MRDNLVEVLEAYTLKNRLRRIWRKIVRIMACFVVFCTTYALILPAITQESDIHCGIPAHAHTDACYAAAGRILACPAAGDVAHTHNDDCRDENGVLVCVLAERQQHIHADGCFDSEDPGILICQDPLAVVHVHSDECFAAAQSVLNCGMEEHAHSLICHSDPQADLESPETWEQSIAFAELSGVWKEDVVAIARTQRGYVESTGNYIVLEDGTVKGYTRYGAWYGDPYGDWAAMFVSFCLNYAGVEEMPLGSDAGCWIKELTAADLFRSQGSHVPGAGELIFFDMDADGDADHVGIITDVTTGEDGTVPRISIIEGDATNRVQERSCSMDDASIVGYGQLPVQLSAAEQKAVNLVIAKIDALPAAARTDETCSQQVAEAYHLYTNLNDIQKKKVTNAGKLMALESVWSVTEYIAYDTFDSDPVTVTQSAHTSDLVALNIFDYYGRYSAAEADRTDINHRYDNVSQEFPGFRWNAGAYPHRYYGAEDGWIADRHLAACIDFGNSLITDYRITEPLYEPDGTVAWGDGFEGQISGSARPVTDEDGGTGAINKVTAGTDRPIGVTEGNGVVSDRLGSDGYPYLICSGLDIGNDDPSLRYLFDEDHAEKFAVRKNAGSIDGLFQRDPVSGEYFYNSRWNHAQYDEETSTFTLYDQVITPNFIRYPFGNFLPFQDITDPQNTAQVQAFNYQGGVRDYILAMLDTLEDCSTATQGTDLSVIQLIRMLESYRASWEADGAWDGLTAAEAMQDFLGEGDRVLQTQLLTELYNIDYDVEKNFFFGMEMEMTFLQAKDGLTGSDNGNNETGAWEKGRDKNNDTLTADDDTMILMGTKDGRPDYPMVFSFTGDDDVWVYVDGIRFLDLSGIHHPVGGRIDFEQGLVCYYQSDPAGNGGIQDEAFQTQSFRDILTQYGGVAEEDLGKYLKQDASGNFTTFHDYSAHTLNFYYLERGSGSSVCDLRFNLPLIQKNTVTVSNEVSAAGGALTDTALGNPDYYFDLVTADGQLLVGPGSVTGVTAYKIRGSDGNILQNNDGTDKVFSTDSCGIFILKAGQTAIFEGIGENQGDFFVRELIPAADKAQYSAVFVNDRQIPDDGTVDWNTGAAPYGWQWYGRSSMAGTGPAFVFRFDNRVDTAKLGSLSITAELIGTETARAFDVEVALDGEKIPVGTAYTVGGEERVVAEDGIVSLASGETAVIPGILSGTAFELRQPDTDGYTVSYAYTASRTALAAQNDAVTGTVHAAQNVGISVTNAEQGATVRIPVTVSLLNGDGAAHAFTVLLEQVTDSTGETLMQNAAAVEQTVQVSDEAVSFYFDLPYMATQLDTLPASFFYRITETDEQMECLDNTQQFVAEVLVEEAEDGIRASLAGIHGSADAAAFTNTLAGSLTLHNTVNGDAAHRAQVFEFILELTAPENVALPTEVQAVRTAADGTRTALTLQPENGVIQLSDLADGETVVFNGIPAGTKWSISQTYAYEFITSTRTGDATTQGRAAAGTVITGDTAVEFINTQTYALPKTGGAGTTLYAMAGLMLMLCSAAFLLYRSKKCRREVA